MWSVGAASRRFRASVLLLIFACLEMILHDLPDLFLREFWMLTLFSAMHLPELAESNALRVCDLSNLPA
jgi:hypothetical protein